MTDFSQHTQSLRRQIEAALSRHTQYDADCPPHLAEAIRHSLLAPGKRLRPLLVLMASEACGYDSAAALPAACSVEMIHTYSLIHDDLPAMDDDELRRGRPTCHVQFGEATAILAGDALLAQAFEILARNIQPPEIAARCVAELARAAGPTALVGGQEDDLRNQFNGGGVEQLERIHRRKTGAMICVSLRLGGLIGRADREQLAALDAYGEKIGLAFQIVDDLLDLSGDASTMGKRTLKDADHGKLTFPAVLGVDASRQRAERLVSEACESIARFGPRAAGLEALARYVLERNH
ncbi:MAG TPA: farnesyl diphosphate synthase [Pirellulaceae bacterium]|nr:farnesyl diphosphate synthase [Pirellulaceae bacterium]